MSTLADVARAAGVSASTVSRALAGSELVNEATRRRIQCLAQEMGFQVNHVARSLATRSTRTLGLVVPEVRNPYYPTLIQLVADRARAAGYSLQLHLSGAEQADEAACLQALRERRADAILLVTGGGGLVAAEEARRLRRAGVPVVLLGWVEGGDEFDTVMGDDAAGGYAVTRHLLEQGYRRIVLLGGQRTRGPYDRIEGFLRALAEAGQATDGALRLGVYTQAQVDRSVDALLDGPDPPTALFAYQDSLAAWILRRLADRGIAVPEAQAVVGFDNLDLGEYLHPHLTTVDYPVEAFAERAVDLLIERIGEEERGAPQRVILTPRLVVRQSCGAREKGGRVSG